MSKKDEEIQQPVAEAVNEPQVGEKQTCAKGKGQKRSLQLRLGIES
jgi:hypothetical protein